MARRRALVFLVTAKLANAGVPLALKEIVDSLDPTRAMCPSVPIAPHIGPMIVTLSKRFVLKAETRKGVVQLSGLVHSQTQTGSVIAIAHKGDGATGVASETSIKKQAPRYDLTAI